MNLFIAILLFTFAESFADEDESGEGDPTDGQERRLSALPKPPSANPSPTTDEAEWRDSYLVVGKESRLRRLCDACLVCNC